MSYTRSQVSALAYEYATLTRLSKFSGGPRIGKDLDPDAKPAITLLQHLRSIRAAETAGRRVETVGSPSISLQEALESRRSIRQFDNRTVLNWTELSLMLALALGESGRMGTLRTYPSASGLYEIETCLSVRKCEGLDEGLWHFDAEEGMVYKLEADRMALSEVHQLAAWAIGSAKVPPVVMLFYADLDLINSTYSALGLSLSLKHVGAMTQNVYLVAEVDGLAVCALGTGSKDAEDRVIQTPNQARFLCLGGVALGGMEDIL